MRQVRFWAIAPFALLAAFSGKPVLQPAQAVSLVSSSFIAAELPQQASLVVPIVHPLVAQGTSSPEPSPEPLPSAQPTPAPGVPSPLPSSSPTSSTVILEQQGELSPSTSSVLNSDNSLYNQYSFEGRQGQVLNMTLESSEFDTYLAIFDTGGHLLGENDDVGESCNYQDEKGKRDFVSKGLCNSQLNITLPTNGSYKVIVNGHDRTDRGKYTLTIREVTKP